MAPMIEDESVLKQELIKMQQNQRAIEAKVEDYRDQLLERLNVHKSFASESTRNTDGNRYSLAVNPLTAVNKSKDGDSA